MNQHPYPDGSQGGADQDREWLTDDDGDLRQRFIALKAEIDDSNASFTATLHRPRDTRRRPGMLRMPALSGATLAVIGVVAASFWLGGPRTSRTAGEAIAPSALRTSSWIAPTDFLLRSRAREILGTIPAIGTSARPARRPQPSLDDSSDTRSDRSSQS